MAASSSRRSVGRRPAAGRRDPASDGAAERRGGRGRSAPTTSSRPSDDPMPAPTTGSSGSSPGSSSSRPVDRRGDRPVARDPAGDPRPPRARPGCSSSSSTTCCRRRARPAKFVARGQRRDHSRLAARRADRRRPEPVLLHLPADRRRRGARRRRAGSRSGWRPIAGLGYIIARAARLRGRIARPDDRRAWSAINLTALVLLAYVAMVIAREQRRARDAAIRLSTIDPLTGLFNRTFFFAAVEREIARSARSGRGFCLLMMDLDELKPINDRLGHFFGDRVLRGVGEVIRVRRPADRHRGPLRRRRVRRAPARDRSDRRVRPGREDPDRRPHDAARAARRGARSRRSRSASSATPTTAGRATS